MYEYEGKILRRGTALMGGRLVNWVGWEGKIRRPVIETGHRDTVMLHFII